MARRHEDMRAAERVDACARWLQQARARPRLRRCRLCRRRCVTSRARCSTAFGSSPTRRKTPSAPLDRRCVRPCRVRHASTPRATRARTHRASAPPDRLCWRTCLPGASTGAPPATQDRIGARRRRPSDVCEEVKGVRDRAFAQGERQQALMGTLTLLQRTHSHCADSPSLRQSACGMACACCTLHVARCMLHVARRLRRDARAVAGGTVSTAGPHAKLGLPPSTQ